MVGGPGVRVGIRVRASLFWVSNALRSTEYYVDVEWEGFLGTDWKLRGGWG